MKIRIGATTILAARSFGHFRNSFESSCPPDKIAWAYSPSRAFSTSSAYKLLALGADGSQAESLNRSARKQF